MSSLSPNYIKRLVFEKYDWFLTYTAKKYDLRCLKQGLDYRDFVNDAIITLIDITSGFNSDNEIISVVMKIIENNAIREFSLLQNGRFFTKTDDFSILNRGSKTDSYSANFIQIYTLLEDYKLGDGKRRCTKCGNTTFYKCTDGLNVKCMRCSSKNSLTSKTNLDSTKLNCIKIYKMVISVCRNPKISSIKLAEICDITQKTACKRLSLIRTIYNQVGSDPIKIINQLLSDKRENKIDLSPKHLTIDKVIEIRRLLEFTPVKEVAKLYEIDVSNMYKIKNRKIHI